MPNPLCRHRTTLRALLLALGIALLVGCGFQPRGHTVGSGNLPSPIRISGITTYTDLYRELDRQLAIAGVEVVTSGTPGSAVLSIMEPRADLQLLSVNSRNRAVEYELIEEAGFALSSADGQRLVAPQRFTIKRIWYRPEVAVLGSDREAVLLRQDMREELAGRIIQRLAVHRHSAE